MNEWEIVGWVSLVLSATQFLPQTLRTIKTKNRGGISLTFWILMASQAGWWVTYGVIEQMHPIIAINFIVLAAAVLMLYALGPSRLYSVTYLGIVALVAGASVPCAHILGRAIVGNLALMGSVLAWLPQARFALIANDLSGLSRGSWSLVVISSVGWLLYGYGIDDWRLQVPALVSGITATIVLARIFHFKN